MLEKYSKQELIQIIKCYDQYLADRYDYEYPDELDEPMSICDFINSEYKAMLEAGYDNYNDFIAGL